MGVHGYVTVLIVRVHDVVVEAPNLVHVAQLRTHDFQLVRFVRTHDPDCFLDRAVRAPTNLDFFAACLGTGSFPSVGSVRSVLHEDR